MTAHVVIIVSVPVVQASLRLYSSTPSGTPEILRCKKGEVAHATRLDSTHSRVQFQRPEGNAIHQCSASALLQESTDLQEMHPGRISFQLGCAHTGMRH